MSAIERIRKALEAVPNRQPNSIIAVYAGDMVETADAIPAEARSQVTKDLRFGGCNNSPGTKVGVNAEHLEELLNNHERTRPAPPAPPPPAPPPPQNTETDPVPPAENVPPSPPDPAVVE